MNRGGRGRGRIGSGVRGRGRSRGVCSSPVINNKRKGLCASLGEHVFTYNEKGAADQMRKKIKQIVEYTGTIYGQDISNELHIRAIVTIDKPQHTQ